MVSMQAAVLAVDLMRFACASQEDLCANVFSTAGIVHHSYLVFRVLFVDGGSVKFFVTRLPLLQCYEFVALVTDKSSAFHQL